MTKHFSAAFGIGLGVLLLASLPFVFSDLDLALSAAAFRQGSWPLGDRWLWIALYRWGTLPGLLLGIGSLAALAASWFKPSWETYRRPAAVVLVTLLLGPGLLVNVLGKGYWGRPRPRDVISLGGAEKFQRVCEPGLPGRGKSFPSGHPSVGYLFCVLFFLDSGKRRRWIWMGTGLILGTSLGIARVLQGAHFTSDVLWSGGLTYLSAAWAARAVPEWFPNSAKPKPAASSWLKKTLIALAGTIVLAGLAFFFLLATPFYKIWEGAVPGTTPDRIMLKLPQGLTQVFLEHRQQNAPLMARVEIHGFGFPKLYLRGNWQVKRQTDLWEAQLLLDLRGWVTEKKSVLHVYVLPEVTVIPGLSPGSDTKIWLDQKPVPDRN